MSKESQFLNFFEKYKKYISVKWNNKITQNSRAISLSITLMVSDCRFGVSPVNYPDPDPEC